MKYRKTEGEGKSIAKNMLPFRRYALFVVYLPEREHVLFLQKR